MILGLNSGDSPTQALADAALYLDAPALQLQQVFLDSTLSWDDGMANSWYTSQSLGGNQSHITVPMLVGPSSGSSQSYSGTGQTTSPQNPSNVTTPTAMTLADVASGVWDELFTATFEAIASVRPGAILRIGWELYGDEHYYPWSGQANATHYGAAFTHLVTLARGVSSSFLFDWNGGQVYGADNWNPMQSDAWPGAEYVDYITTDPYDTNTPGAAGWNSFWVPILEVGMEFAAAQGKPYGLSEWGLWSSLNGDDYGWVEGAYYWLRANAASLSHVIITNTGGGGDLVDNPQSAAVVKQLFGTWARQLQGLPASRFATTTSGGRYRLR